VRYCLIAILILSACSSDSTLPPGAVCKTTDDCDSDLTCLDIAQVTSTSCMVVGKTCSTTCTDDASCAPLGANFRCFATCTTDKVCAMVANP
jgi:hypothetical protein